VKTWPDGRKYEGEWKIGKPIGIGKKVYPDGKLKEGYWDKGKFIEGSKLFIA
jgi:antitoxin component YwqK of YwqJK toxin-antitoxin module